VRTDFDRTDPGVAVGRLTPMRTPNALLQALNAFKALDPRISLNEVIAFLHTAENEGLSVQDLADLAGMTQSTASRSLRALGPANSPWSQPPAVGLVEAYLNPHDGRSHSIRLSARGRAVRDRLDDIIQAGATLQPAREQAA
jgi:DNA-binding MarR family transcriptional regulator